MLVGHLGLVNDNTIPQSFHSHEWMMKQGFWDYTNLDTLLAREMKLLKAIHLENHVSASLPKKRKCLQLLDPGISEYSVSETTLEQLFIQFAKHQAPPKTMQKHRHFLLLLQNMSGVKQTKKGVGEWLVGLVSYS